MTSIYKLDLEVLKMYLQTTNELSRRSLSQFERYGQTDAQTDATENVTTPHARVVTMEVDYDSYSWRSTISIRLNAAYRQFCSSFGV